jgi:class III poly(R)-hydroxyalkanoic acid synthase PhaE subunit
MSESNKIDAEGVSAWIEQQRENLRPGSGPSSPGGHAPEDLAQRWLELSRTYLESLFQYAQLGLAARPRFELNDELLGAWRTAWMNGEMMGESATARVSELLGRLPPIGLAREHTEAWRELAAAQLECRRLEQEFKAVLTRVQAEALALLEEKVRERQKTATPIATFRDLYDLWVECGEQVYAKVAHSDSYGRLQAELGNATMRFRARQQKVIEHALRQFDLPTRSELNSVHRQLRELRAQLTQAPDGEGSSPSPGGAGLRRRKPKARLKTARAKRARRTTR